MHIHAEPRCQPLLPDPGSQDQDGAWAAPVVILGDSPQPVVDGSPPQGRTLAHHSKTAAVVGGEVEWSPTPGVVESQPVSFRVRQVRHQGPTIGAPGRVEDAAPTLLHTETRIFDVLNLEVDPVQVKVPVPPLWRTMMALPKTSFTW